MFTVSTENFQKYVRIALYWITGFFAAKGFGNSATTDLIITIGMTIATFGWTVYGSRVAAKINDLLGTGVVSVIVTNDKALADSIPNDAVKSTADVKVTDKK